MGVRSGRYRHRFELLKPKLGYDGNPARDEFGAETGECTTVARPWCEVANVSSSESVSTAINGQEVITFQIRYSRMFENPDTNMIIRFEGNLYDITSVVDPFKRRIKMHINATKRR